MEMTQPDENKQKDYARQAQVQWGHTDAYAQFRRKSRGRSSREEAALGIGLMEIFAEMGAVRGADPAGEAAGALVKKLRSYITEHYYDCTDEILLGLGQMYAAGGAFTRNIDAAGGCGTAEFACAAIRAHCR